MLEDDALILIHLQIYIQSFDMQITTSGVISYNTKFSLLNSATELIIIVVLVYVLLKMGRNVKVVNCAKEFCKTSLVSY